MWVIRLVVRVPLRPLALASLVGCTAIGIPATSDPAKKLDLAWELIHQGRRPFPTEVLIQEAIEIYQRGGDEIGLARAYSIYGVFFRVPLYLPEYRFQDKSATYETRFKTSIDYFEKARSLYQKDAYTSNLSTVYFQMGMTYAEMDERESACTSFQKSLESHQQYTTANPGVRRPVPAGFATWEDFVTAERMRRNCD